MSGWVATNAQFAHLYVRAFIEFSTWPLSTNDKIDVFVRRADQHSVMTLVHWKATI